MTELLMTHPRVLKKLTTEIRNTFQRADQITMTNVNSCNYLLAVIEESLRIYPPSPAAHPRFVPRGGMTIDGQFVPEGVAVGITTYAIMHSSLNFKDPEDFIPERWTGEVAAFANDKREAAQAFSFGPRNCIGRNLAYVELKLVMARLLFHFDLENQTAPNWRDQRTYMIWVKKPLMVKLRPVQ
jgi:cytochrome P450